MSLFGFNSFNGVFLPVKNEKNQTCIIDREGRVIELPKTLHSDYWLSSLENNIFLVNMVAKGRIIPGNDGYFKLIPKEWKKNERNCRYRQ